MLYMLSTKTSRHMNTKVASTTAAASDSCSLLVPMAWGLGAGITAGVAIALFGVFKLPLALRAGLVLLPLFLSIGYVQCVVGMYRRADELQRRIQLESLGFAFPATAILMMAGVLLEKAKILPVIDWSLGSKVVAMCLLWLIGHLIASRRYR